MNTEVIQFIGALVLFVSILIGSYWFVYAPSRRNFNRRDEARRQRLRS